MHCTGISRAGSQVIGQGTGVRDAATLHAPFTLSPTEFPAADFHTAEALMPLFSSLIHTVSRDLQYLSSTLRTTAETDSFTRQLMGVLLRTEGSRMKNGSPITLGLHRSDYMQDEPSGKLLQVRIPPAHRPCVLADPQGPCRWCLFCYRCCCLLYTSPSPRD